MPDRSGRELVKFIVAAKGNLPLAAERLGMDQNEVVAAIIGDDQSVSLTEQLRALLTIGVFDSAMAAQLAFRSSIDELTPKELSQAYTQLVAQFAALTKVASPELSDDAPYDATMAKQRIISRLDRYRKKEVVEEEAS
jgi:hypothetical protein